MVKAVYTDITDEGREQLVKDCESGLKEGYDMEAIVHRVLSEANFDWHPNMAEPEAVIIDISKAESRHGLENQKTMCRGLIYELVESE